VVYWVLAVYGGAEAWGEHELRSRRRGRWL
jgi:hypothetical protein